jgi:hypothetical protein
MLKNFSFVGKGVTVKDPRFVMRVLIGSLLVANLVAAVIAFKPFGGSADDLRRQTESLRAQLSRAEGNLAASKKQVEKVQTARTQGDQFLVKYIVDRREMASSILAELDRLVTQAGVKPRQIANSLDAVEGSDTLAMMSISAGFEGSYANLMKLVNLIDRSPRFLIIESLVASAPQGTGQAAGAGDKALNVTLRIDTFVRDESGGAAL